MISDEVQDTHFCLKCHLTISGLDNYVAHRKSNCEVPKRTSSPDLSLKADDFFSLLELQSSTKKSLKTSKNPGILTRSKTGQKGFLEDKTSRTNDWIGGHNLRELGEFDNQTKLINAVDRISGNIKKDEKFSQRITYPENEPDDDSNSSFSEENLESDEELPGPSRTSQDNRGFPIQWNDHPPPSYTGGKWKPMEAENFQESSNFPPPNHTKGKWIPGKNLQVSNSNPPLRKSSGTVQYWCGPCNRRLASKIVFQRHLKSDLHYKRTLHEREFDDPVTYPNTIKEDRRLEKDVSKKKISDLSKRKKSSKGLSSVKCEVCRSKVFVHLMGKHLISHYHCRKRDFSKIFHRIMVLENIWKVVLQSPFQCGKCKFYCNTMEIFMEHWKSKGHMENPLENGQYFLCSFCKFESAENSEMERHLISSVHSEVVLAINRSMPIVIKLIQPITCKTCAKTFKFNRSLLNHCKNFQHTPTFSGTNLYQSKFPCPNNTCPKILHSQKAFQNHSQKCHNQKNFYFCTPCNLTFESLRDSRLHRRSQSHKFQSMVTKNKDNDKDLSKVCRICFQKFQNVMVLKEHLRAVHPNNFHSCSLCGERFTLPQEVTRHIRSNSCLRTFQKDQLEDKNEKALEAFLRCQICTYTTNSQAELVFHEILHRDSENFEGSSRDPLKKALTYKCPICSKIFRKSSLRCHLRLHFGERPFKCPHCKASYTRRGNLDDHIKLQHKKISKKEKFCEFCKTLFESRDEKIEHVKREHPEENSKKKILDDELEGQDSPRYICSYCGKIFMKKYTLQQHLIIHTGKEIRCPNSGCLFRARSTSDLKNHLATHSKETPFECSKCDFRTKTKHQLNRHVTVHEENSNKKFSCPHCNFSARLSSHLKRHLRLHTGAKPYKCPHCAYTCNNLENLRKHVLSTNKHPGKCIYECKFCELPQEFATNFAKDFKVHLLTNHGDQFDSPKVAASYILGIYNASEDATRSIDPSLETQDNSQSQRKSPSSAKELVSLACLPSTSRGIEEPLLLSSSEGVPSGQMDVVYVELTDSWCMEGYYDVGESGTLVPFSSGDQFEDEDRDDE